MRKNRIFKPQLKAQAVLQIISGTKSAAQVCRDLNINESILSRWKQQLLTHAALVFERDSEATEKDEQIADLQRLVGRLALELEVAKKPRSLPSIKPAKTGGDHDAVFDLSRSTALPNGLLAAQFLLLL